MDDSMAQADVPPSAAAAADLPAWKNGIHWAAAVLLAALFLAAGVWKITDPIAAATKMTQALIPAQLSIACAISFGVAETFAAVLLLVPGFRRWGAWLAGLMLVAFMVYIGWNYARLVGEDCNCFPWIKRAIGPGFFISDGVMLLLALLAGAWARPSAGLRNAAVILGAIGVFAGAMYGVMAVRESGVNAPMAVMVEGRAFPLRQGRVFVYFFDPECGHCDQAARAMAKFVWKDVRLLAVATAQPKWARVFLDDTKLPAALTYDVQPLRAAFQFSDTPYGVALVDGRVAASFRSFDEQEPAAGLRRAGFIE